MSPLARSLATTALCAAACVGCAPVDTPDPDAPAADPYDWPLDDVLRLDHLQAKGTHNSYHVETTPLDEWAYTHAPLEEQLDAQGVRQLELDVSWDADLGAHRVFHVPVIDEGTTCDTFVACLEAIRGWSDAHLGHHPILVLVETKDPWGDDGPDRLDDLDAELRAVWPDRLITPDDLLGGHPDLASAAADGWPFLGEVRGHALFVLHDGGERRDTYVAGLAGRPMFPDAKGDLEVGWGAVSSINDPWDPRLPEALAAGHLVRTRADGDNVEPFAGDTARRDAALASGAHFVSTDYPAPVDGVDYVVEVPGGSPSRCNPVTAPSACTAEAIETPDGL